AAGSRWTWAAAASRSRWRPPTAAWSCGGAVSAPHVMFGPVFPLKEVGLVQHQPCAGRAGAARRRAGIRSRAGREGLPQPAGAARVVPGPRLRPVHPLECRRSTRRRHQPHPRGRRRRLHRALLRAAAAQLQHPDVTQQEHPGILEYDRAQLRELMTGYGKIDLVFLDGPAAGLRDVVWDAQPDAVVARGATETPEQNLPGVPLDRPWEACITMG